MQDRAVSVHALLQTTRQNVYLYYVYVNVNYTGLPCVRLFCQSLRQKSIAVRLLGFDLG